MSRILSRITIERTLITMLVVGIAFPLLFRHKPPMQSAAVGGASLEWRLRDAERELKALEQTVADQKRRLDRLMPPSEGSSEQPSQREIGMLEVPQTGLKNWRPREFNGLTYYVIPLETGSSTTPVLVPAVLR